VLLAIALEAGSAHAEYVRDEVRVALRSGPSSEYSPLGVVRSGDEVKRLERWNDWSRVRTAEGKEGWIPSRYLATEVPPSVALPQLQTKLKAAEQRIRDLEGQLDARARELGELEAMRTQLGELEAENHRLLRGSRWKELLAGGGIIVVGMMIGSLLSRGERARRRLRL
jgi:SH3 domain protein